MGGFDVGQRMRAQADFMVEFLVELSICWAGESMHRLWLEISAMRYVLFVFKNIKMKSNRSSGDNPSLSRMKEI
jgi:hypothetical protein